MKYTMQKLIWNSDNIPQVPTMWFWETPNHHVAGEIELTKDGLFSAGVAMIHHVDDDLGEMDWKPLGEFPSLAEAKKAVIENTTVTVQGELISNGKIY